MSAIAPVSTVDTPAASYTLPQGIALAGPQAQAVPRRTGAYDTEGMIVSTAPPAQLVFFQNTTAFGQATTILTSKIYGRDTNITSKNGNMALGERLYAYGLTAKIDSAGQVLNSANGVQQFDQWREYIGVSWFQFNLGTDEFISCQARDVPFFAPKNPFTTIGATLVFDIASEGMFDLTVQGDPYVLDQQEDFRVYLNYNKGNGATETMLLETYITLRIEGIRLKALRQ